MKFSTTKRFVKEYAAYKTREITENHLMQERIKMDLYQQINRSLQLLGRGLITVDEAIQAIATVKYRDND